jgi:hypothetical protein
LADARRILPVRASAATPDARRGGAVSLSRPPAPADETAADLWDDSPVAAVFAVLTVVAVGILAFGAAYALAPLLWPGGSTGLEVLRAVLALVIAFVGGPPVIYLQSSALRRLTAEWKRRR